MKINVGKSKVLTIKKDQMGSCEEGEDEELYHFRITLMWVTDWEREGY